MLMIFSLSRIIRIYRIFFLKEISETRDLFLWNCLLLAERDFYLRCKDI